MDAQVLTDARAKVTRRNDAIEVALTDPRPETLRLFGSLGEDQLDAIAADAWRIGLRALGSALAQAEEARLVDAGKRLVDEVDQRVKTLLEMQQKGMVQTLEGYFDPSKGQLRQRLASITEPDGELARLLEKHVALDGSTLARTLAAQVGAESPLLKKLSVTDSEGIVQQLEKRFAETLGHHKQALALALDPQAEDGPVRRFLLDLHERLQKAGADQAKMVQEVTKALDANDEDSLLNRLNRDVQKANAQLLAAINPEDEKSPMFIVKTTLERMIRKHMESNQELLEKAQEEQQKFNTEVREAIARIEKQKQADARSTFGGFAFEDAVTTFVEEALVGGPYIVEATGNNPGLIRGSKVGDQVVRFTDESAFAGAGLVIESKRAGNYTVARALEELAEARKNRDCQAGLFVMAASSAPKGWPRFARYGPDVLLTWDDEGGTLDAYLHAGLLSGLALVSRTERRGDAGDIEALNDVDKRLVAEVDRLVKMEGFTANILRDANKIDEEIRRAKKKLDVLIRNAREVLEALDVVVRDEEAERGSPIGSYDTDYERAVEAVRRVEVGMSEGVMARRVSGDEPDESCRDENGRR